MKILVTGIGAISSIGVDVKENIDSLKNGRHGMGKTTLFPTRLDVPVSEVKYTNSQLQELLSLSASKTYSRTALLGMMAAREAVNDTEIDVTSQRVGFISSTSVGGMDRSENFYTAFGKDHTKGHLRDVVAHDCGDSTELIASYLGISEFVTTVSTACSSAANAVMLAARMLKHDLLDAVVVGGTDALCKFTLNGFNSLMILDNEHARPMDASRAGLNLGEGAGYMVLQADNSNYKKTYCQLTGYTNANDAYHQTASSPDGDGPYKCMSEAVAMANITPSDIDYINLHGTGTPNNDLSESKAIIRLFGENTPPLSSVKSFIGHTLGASEAIEAVYSILSVHNGFMYPNLNFSDAIEETGLVPITTWTEGAEVNHVLSNSFGFGGNVSTLIFSKIC